MLRHLAVQRRVFEAVARLEEPYRTTILLRYYRGHPASAIAPSARVETRANTPRTTPTLPVNTGST